ncbi:uncharacterized protein [Chaetodon trifascialis]|uniref:uncharacterized protein n=1 Tax=Chaetodon trifascialis TaxID=109706 RepID=UPI00399346B3
MNKCSAARPAAANNAKCPQMSKTVANADHVGLRAQSRDCKNRQGAGKATAHSQEPRQRPLSTASTPAVTPCSHQRRWSADFCKRGTSPVITVRKSKKEPQPPQRHASLLQPNTASHLSTKRYSCPSIGVFRSRSHLHSSSSSSSTSSCSSPPPVPTSIITGHDPLGWKLQPKSTSSSQARTKRLSLQIPLPVIPDLKTIPAPNSQSENTPNPDRSKPKPPLRPKPPRRHSDSSAFLRSLSSPQPAVTLEELCNVHLRTVTVSDDVFSEGNEEEVKAITRPRKIPPPVPPKTPMAKQIARLIAHSRQRCATNEENIYTSVIRPKPKLTHTQDHSSLHERRTGLRVDPSCDRERSTPRFPG